MAKSKRVQIEDVPAMFGGLAAKMGVENRPLKSPPLWAGPDGEGPQGGISQSMLSKFLAGPRQFAAYALDGWGPHDSFSPAMEYGSMFHLCEEKARTAEKGYAQWEDCLLEYCKLLQARYQYDAEKVAHWYQYCLAQFPVYREFWEGEEYEKNRTPLLSEHPFDVRYTLPSGRKVRLRGKMDGVSLYDGKVWLDENKTKSQIDQEKICRQLKFDLQTMLYLTVLQLDMKNLRLKDKHKFPLSDKSIAGVRYNVVKRSTHKTAESMLKKLTEDLADGRGGEWFGRWQVPISADEVKTFRDTCLDPLLEWVCAWYDIVAKGLAVHLPVHVLSRVLNYRHPYGCYNPMDEGGTSEYDFYLADGSTAGLRKLKTLFPELE